MVFYDLGYGSFNGWIATLGRTPEQRFDAATGKEDFTEQRQISAYLESWRPSAVWSPQPICLQFTAQGRNRHKADRIFHNIVGPLISENAVNVMRPFLERAGDILPMNVMNSDEKFYLWWVPWIEESVDLGRSKKFPNGRTIKQYAYNEGRVKGLMAFRPHSSGMYTPDSHGQVIVNDEVRKAWLDAGLTGIDFSPA